MNKFGYLAIIILLSSFCLNNASAQIDQSITVPLGGNGWLSKNAKSKIRKDGLREWSNATDVIAIYFRTETIGQAVLSLRLSVPEGKSRILVKAVGSTFEKEVSNLGAAVVKVGEINISKPGYVKVELSGINKTGDVFAEVSDLVVSGAAVSSDVAYVKNDEGNYFYWGHRGPSVHLGYKMPPEAEQIEWFYNEIIVPDGEDKLGTYYMANGFAEGYFGMQVNSSTERRVLFSVWSPFQTDDPKSIPDSMKVVLKKKGSITKTGEFGNEGSGGQSYLHYPWKTGKRYAFLIHAKPDLTKRSTIYTAYFNDLEKNVWILVASFERPQLATHLKGLHSFLENFSPATGDQSRKSAYTNQWAIDTKGVWHEITKANFTADATARIGYRKDYAAGIEGTSFFLKNCGFFDDFTPILTPLERKSSGQKHPFIDFAKLP